MQIIKQSTARTLLIGPFLDDTDGKTAETGLTIAQADVRISKNGGNMAQKNEATSCSHDELGHYACPVDVTDTATLGLLKLMVHESGALPVWQEFLVVTANVWDTLCSTDTLEADLTQIAGVVQSATDLKDFADAGYDPATNKVQGVVLADTVTTNTDMRGTDSAALAATALSDSVWTDAKAAFLDHSINTVDTNVDTLLARITAARAGYFDNLSAGAVALASVCLDARLAELDAANLPTDVANVKTDTAAVLLDTGTDGVLLTTTATSAQLVDDIWDELLTGGTHNIANSAGRIIREIAAYSIHGGTAQAGTITSITLDSNASATDGIYNRNLIAIIAGTGAGQTRQIADYVGSTKVALIDREWRVTPDATSEFVVTASNVFALVDQGQVQSATSTTITIRPYASSINNTYLCNQLVIIAGTGRGQSRLVGAYNGTTKVITICGDNWVTTPDNTSIYVLLPYGTTCTSCIGTEALGLINAEVDTALVDYGANTTVPDAAGTAATLHTATDADIAALNDITVADIIAGIADGTYDLEEMLRIMFAVISGKSSGGGTTTLTFRDSADSKNRVSETVDGDGNRTSVTRDGS